MKYNVPPYAGSCEHPCKFQVLDAMVFSVYIEKTFDKHGEKTDNRSAPTQTTVGCSTCGGRWLRNSDYERKSTWTMIQKPRPPFDLDEAVKKAQEKVALTIENSKHQYTKLNGGSLGLNLGFVTVEGYNHYQRLNIGSSILPGVVTNGDGLVVVSGHTGTLELSADYTVTLNKPVENAVREIVREELKVAPLLSLRYLRRLVGV